ncbi:kelch repeat-containing protein [Gaoshiqia sediminis]|uniref:Cyclically-permuted mutarotase family protein n=1 Tax=Gaoshiqia sediminis TaxID=2986998 RepID=A0AA42C7T9_9BACT|nr:kelch repeat-containing protein [Gaoshiqia sediminis]MCW0483904.1 hypothetical protein [Gaoshiqia sediminis]
MKSFGWGLVLSLFLLACNQPKTIESKIMKITWDTLAVIPPAQEKTVQLGLAGPVAGAYQNNLIVAGGSNFEDAMPWQGGTKLYHDRIYVLTQNANNQYDWWQPDEKLPVPLAYSACVSNGKGVLSIGGETAEGPVKRVFMISVDGEKIRITDYPHLPIGLTSAGAAQKGSVVYLAGGLDLAGATSHFFALDLAAVDSGWKALPDLPVPLSHAVVACQFDGQEDCVFVLGGRNKSGITSTFLSDIWKFVPSKNKWQQAGKLQVEGDEVFGFSAGTGLAVGEHGILLFGGDRGNIFNQTERLIDAAAKAETADEREKIQQQKAENLTNHPGFSRDVYLFNTLTGKLSRIGALDGLAQVTTNAFWWDQQIIIPGGEIRPGVRSAVITRGIISLDE